MKPRGPWYRWRHSFPGPPACPPSCQEHGLLSHPLTPGPHLRLVGGLASENVRWAESVESFKGQGITLCGDVLLISAFVSYVGYFTKKYRNELMERFWIPYTNHLKVRGPVVFITQDVWGGPWGRGGQNQPGLTVTPAMNKAEAVG